MLRLINLVIIGRDLFDDFFDRHYKLCPTCPSGGRKLLLASYSAYYAKYTHNQDFKKHLVVTYGHGIHFVYTMKKKVYQHVRYSVCLSNVRLLLQYSGCPFSLMFYVKEEATKDVELINNMARK